MRCTCIRLWLYCVREIVIKRNILQISEFYRKPRMFSATKVLNYVRQTQVFMVQRTAVSALLGA